LAVRGKSAKRKVTKAQEPTREKVVDSKVTLHIDLMFPSGDALLVGYVNQLCLLLHNWIKGKGVIAVRKALERQRHLWCLRDLRR
jgi:hypothetical protein